VATRSPTETAPNRGRPRSEQARRAILKAATALATQGGYPALTIEAVAERAGVARTTIYRWWANRAVLAIDVLVDIGMTAAPPPTSTDSLRAIRLELRRIAAAASGTAGELLLALLSESQHDEAVRTALHERVTYPRREASMRAVSAAQDRGELRDDLHPSVVVDLLYGPIFYRLLMGLDAPTERFAEQVFDRVLGGVGM
jgi:AcrR family transcriptional regulator